MLDLEFPGLSAVELSGLPTLTGPRSGHGVVFNEDLTQAVVRFSAPQADATAKVDAITPVVRPGNNPLGGLNTYPHLSYDDDDVLVAGGTVVLRMRD